MKDKIKLALCQISSKRENKAANLQKIEELTKRAMQKGADLAIFPEMSLTGYVLHDQVYELAEQITPQTRDIKAQVVYAVKSEYAETLVDITRRRTSLAMKANYALDLLPVLTETLTRYCGWSQEKCHQQLEFYRNFMEENCIPDYVMESSEYLQKAEVTA